MSFLGVDDHRREPAGLISQEVKDGDIEFIAEV